MRLRYVATTRLATSHIVDTEYTIDHGDPIRLLPEDTIKQAQSVGLDQQTIETNLEGTFRVWRLQTKSITTATAQTEGVEHWEEWFFSVMGGITFEMDPNDAQDDNDFVDCILVSVKLTPSLQQLASGTHYRYTLVFREV